MYGSCNSNAIGTHPDFNRLDTKNAQFVNINKEPPGWFLDGKVQKSVFKLIQNPHGF